MNDRLQNKQSISNNAPLDGIDFTVWSKKRGSRVGKKKCNHCNYRNYRKALMQHVNEVHLKIKPYSCDFCEHSCSRKPDMEKHMNSVHLKIKPFTCQYCDRSFVAKSYVKMQFKFDTIPL